MYLVAGLGNPGPQYVGTRHNAGFLVLDCLARRFQAVLGKVAGGAQSARIQLGAEPVVLVKPVRFMNLSGQPTADLVSFYKVPLDHVVAIHDDMDIPFGDVRVKVGGGHGGHNGLRDLHRHLGGAEYLRVRFGVSRPPAGWDPANYVLGHFSSAEQAGLEGVVNKAADAVEFIVRSGVVAAMNHFNTRSAEPRSAGI